MAKVKKLQEQLNKFNNEIKDVPVETLRYKINEKDGSKKILPAGDLKTLLFSLIDNNSGKWISKEAKQKAIEIAKDSELKKVIGYDKDENGKFRPRTIFISKPTSKGDGNGDSRSVTPSIKYDTLEELMKNIDKVSYVEDFDDCLAVENGAENTREEEPADTRIEDVNAALDAAIAENAELDKRVLDSAEDEEIKENAEFDMSAKESRSAAKVFAENKEINELQKVKRSSSVRTIVLGSVAALGLIGTVVGSSIAAVRGNIIKEQESVIENYDQLTNEMLNKASEILKDYQVTNEYALPVVGINEAGNRVAENDPSAVKHAFVISTGDQARVAREYVSVLTEEGYKKYNADNISEFTVKDFESAGDAYRFAMGVNDVVITNTAKYYAEALEKIDNPEDLTIAVNGAEMTIKNLRDSYVTIFNEHSKCATDIAGLQMQIDELAQNLEASDAEKKEMEATILVYKETEQNLSAQLIEKGEIIANLQKQLEEANEKLAQWETKLPEQGDESTSGGNNSGIIVDDSNKNENSGIDKGESDSSNSEWNFGA